MAKSQLKSEFIVHLPMVLSVSITKQFCVYETNFTFKKSTFCTWIHVIFIRLLRICTYSWLFRVPWCKIKNGVLFKPESCQVVGEHGLALPPSLKEITIKDPLTPLVHNFYFTSLLHRHLTSTYFTTAATISRLYNSPPLTSIYNCTSPPLPPLHAYILHSHLTSIYFTAAATISSLYTLPPLPPSQA